MALVRFAATVGGFTMISRVLGLVRDILIAAVMGTGPISDAFLVAFKLPNFFRRLFAEGAFNAGFVPLFARLLEERGQEQARRFAEQVLSLLLVTLLVFVTVFQVCMPWLMHGLAPGFADKPWTFDLAVSLTRLTFPYLLFISLVSLLAGILNSLQRFAAAAAAPILLNLSLILALTVFTTYTRTPGHAAAWGVAVAGILQFLWLLHACERAGILLRLPRPRLSPKIKELMRLMLPVALGAGVMQVNLLVDIILASLLREGSITYLYLADRLVQLPIGVVGVAVGTALLPTLSRLLAAGEEQSAKENLNRATELSMLLAFPATAALVLFSTEFVQVIYQRGGFTGGSARATATALSVYAFGLPAYVMVKVLGPAYFARKDTRTPVVIGVIAVVVNFILNIILMRYLQHVGLALATALSGWLNVFLLMAVLYRRRHFRPDTRLPERLEMAVVATAVMAIGTLFMAWFVADLFVGGELAGILGLVLLVGSGLVLYGLSAIAFGAVKLAEIKALRRRG